MNIKGIVKITLLFATLFFASCAPKLAPRAVIVPIIAPRVEKVSTQARVTSTQADKTVETIGTVKTKYAHYQDKQVEEDITVIAKEAEKTAIESKKTEFQLDFLKQYAENVDIQASELTKQSEEKDQTIYKQNADIQKVKTTVIEQKADISKKNSYLIAAAAIILILGALIIKPWRFFL